MRLYHWSEGRAARARGGWCPGDRRYNTRRPQQRRRAGSGQQTGARTSSLPTAPALLLLRPLLSPESPLAECAPALRQPRCALSRPSWALGGQRIRGQSCPGWPGDKLGCSSLAGGAHGNFGEAKNNPGSGGSSNDSLVRACCAFGHLEPGELGRRGVHMLAQPPPGRLLQLRHSDPGQGSGEEAGEGWALWHAGLHRQADEDVPRLQQDAPCTIHLHGSFRKSLWP
ncbi:metalloproteinase inhibitor 3 isoform X1 [Elephas maximus indicus]|uniref:metalloproteinase inhibitor 3 isoform X1 n=1 Tax=Elephas maximus indicus TaxID=99487 RepID=UPI002115DED0|nr:metalloproteinase inhibitor 3 isoform X1 [Elephas maximus indicus]